MDTQTETAKETINPAKPADLIYGVDDRPPFRDAFFAALQHLLAIFVAIITPPLIICGALKTDLETTGFMVSMALFASGISTFIQCRKVGPVGAGLLCIQGTSFSFIGPIISMGLSGGLPLIFGVCIAASPIEMIISRTFRYMRSIITPLVSGIVVLLIGLSLVKVGVVSCGGGYGAMDNGTFGSLEHVGIAAVVMGSVLFFNRCKNKYLRMSSIVLGLCIGYGIALAMGKVDFSQVTSQNIWSFNIPVPFKYGLDFNISSFIAIGLIYLITAIEATGDVTANSMISGKSIGIEPVPGPHLQEGRPLPAHAAHARRAQRAAGRQGGRVRGQGRLRHPPLGAGCAGSLQPQQGHLRPGQQARAHLLRHAARPCTV